MLHLRLITPDDFQALKNICYPAHFPPRIFAEFERSFQRQERGTAFHLLGISGERIVATAQLIHHRGRGEIAEVVVGRAYRGRGFGTVMIRHLLGLAIEKGWLPVEVMVAETNLRARMSYERAGFRFSRLVELPNGEKAVVLVIQPAPEH